MLMPRPLARLMALLFLAALVYALATYPLRGTWLAPLLLVYAIALLRWPACWLFALPALLPVLDLAPVTGWFFLEEIDLLLLLTLVSAYWRLAPRRPAPAPMLMPGPLSALRPVPLPIPLSVPLSAAPGGRPVRHADIAILPPAIACWLLLLAGACGIGIGHGILPLPPLDANAFTSYLSPYNAVRVGKAWCWALLLLVPLRQAAGPRLDGVRRYFIPGMLTGLLLVSCAAVRERLLFPGLLNFSSDYRITAPFSAMHTGGAALDGYLALAMPLLWPWILGRDTTLRPALASSLALLLMVLAAYVALATFSRGLYAAAGSAVLMLAGLAWSRAASTRINARRSLLRLMILLVLPALLLLWTLNAVFAASGYRGLAAALVIVAAALALAGAPLRSRPLMAGLLAGVATQAALAMALPANTQGTLKPPYLLFAGAMLVFGAALVPAMPPPLGRGQLALPLGSAGFACLLINGGWIVWHWSGASGLPSATCLLGLALLAPCLNLAAGRPLWRISGRVAAPGLAALLAAGVLLPVCHGYFVAERFSTTSGDLADRMRHWRQVWRLMDDDLPTLLFGMGMGTFPYHYFWGARDTPPGYRYVERDANRYLELRAGDYAAGYGEMLRMLQIVPLQPARRYVLDIDVWNTGPPAFLHVNLCQRVLLYPENCSVLPLRQVGPTDRWRHYQIPLDSGVLDGAGGWLSPPVQLEIAVEGTHAALGIDNVSLLDMEQHRQLIRNGSFSEANLGWFFSSDRHHLPWHIKNLELNVLFELGLFGVVSLAGLLATGAAGLLRRACAGEVLAAAWLASLTAFLVVGLFDSLLDVPRITLLFLLLLFAGVLRPHPN